MTITAELPFSDQLECASCRIIYKEPVPNMFSFNSPLGACEACRGFGRTIDIDLDLVVPDPTLSLKDGAIKPWRIKAAQWERRELLAFCQKREDSGDCALARTLGRATTDCY